MRGAKRKAPKKLTAKPVAEVGVEYPCPICDGLFASLDRHHIVPQSTAASSLSEEQGEGPTVDLCASCHRAVHSQALSQFKGTDRVYLTDRQLRRAKRLVDIIVVCLQRDSVQQSPSQRKKVTISLTKAQIDTIDAYKIDTQQSREAAILELLALGLQAVKAPLTPPKKPVRKRIGP